MMSNQHRDPTTFARGSFGMGPMTWAQAWSITVVACAVGIGGLAYVLS